MRRTSADRQDGILFSSNTGAQVGLLSFMMNREVCLLWNNCKICNPRIRLEIDSL